MTDIGTVREQIRLLVDPLLIRFREELYGSGVSFGNVQPSRLPSTIVYVDNIDVSVGNEGYIKGITTYSGSTLVGSDQTELSFIGDVGVTTAGERTTVDLSRKLTSPLTTDGDLLYRAGGVAARLAIGDEGDVLTVSGGVPQWSPITFSGGGGGSGDMDNPMTTLGDIIVALTGGTPARLGIGAEGEVLGVESGVPAWITVSGVGGGSATGDTMRIYQAHETALHTDNPTPTSNTLVDGLTITLPASTSVRVATVSAVVAFTTDPTDHTNHFLLTMDGTNIFPITGITPVFGDSFGTTVPTDSNPFVYLASIAEYAITVPGDNATHTIQLEYNASASTDATTFHARSIVVKTIPSGTSATILGASNGGQRARVYNNADIAIANNTTTALTFNSSRYDNDFIHETVTNPSRLTCTTSGAYHITGQISWAANATGTRYLDLMLNGTTIIATMTKTPTSDVCRMDISTDYELDAGDYVEMRVHQSSGGSLNVRNLSNYSPEFMMHRIG